ncbi:hypothetical protein BDZ97DRAFT_587453 [Flammula alnicola]|nr:hypothetical protein BDZ97DRAFT_587453 [Flammula alnicola]
MRNTAAEVAAIEHLAQEVCKYGTICGQQADVLRQDQPNSYTTMARVQESPLVAQHGQPGNPQKAKSMIILCIATTSVRLCRRTWTPNRLRQNHVRSIWRSHMPCNLSVGHLEESFKLAGTSLLATSHAEANRPWRVPNIPESRQSVRKAVRSLARYRRACDI